LERTNTSPAQGEILNQSLGLPMTALIAIWSTVRGFAKRIPWQVWAAIGAAVALFFYTNFIDSRATERERLAWVEKVADIRKERDAANVKAIEADTLMAAASELLIQQERREIDSATRDIPDQGLTARQRARTCIELRRQGRRCELPATAPSGTVRP
jgi:hypothetical protein